MLGGAVTVETDEVAAVDSLSSEHPEIAAINIKAAIALIPLRIDSLFDFIGDWGFFQVD